MAAILEAVEEYRYYRRFMKKSGSVELVVQRGMDLSMHPEIKPNRCFTAPNGTEWAEIIAPTQLKVFLRLRNRVTQQVASDQQGKN